MSNPSFPVVSRMEGLWPHQLAKVEMHRARRGGDLGHVDLSRQNRILIGGEDWVAETLARIDEARYENYNRELDALKKRKRKKDLMARMVEGPCDPWRDSQHGPMRELILTANKDFFAGDFSEFSGGPSHEERFEELAVAWLKKTFGGDLVHTRADCDETAYHIHAVILPLATTRDGRTMLQPSRHAVIADYEHFQNEIGTAFAPLGLVRGERRAQAIREARERGETPPRQRRHVRTRAWREEEERRLAQARDRLEVGEAVLQRAAAQAKAELQAERAALATAKVEQQRQTAEAEARMKTERARLEADEALQWRKAARAKVTLQTEHAILATAKAEQQRQAAEAEVRMKTERARLEADEAVLRRKVAQAKAALQAEHAVLATAKAEQQRQAAEAEARMKTERARLAVQAQEQDAVLAAAEALGAGLIDPTQDRITLLPAKLGDPVATGIMARLRKSPAGWRRFASALAPGWQRMRKAAVRAAEPGLARDRALINRDRDRDRDDIEDVWEQLATITKHLLPKEAATRTARERVKRALALWRTLKARDARLHNARSRDLGQRDD